MFVRILRARTFRALRKSVRASYAHAYGRARDLLRPDVGNHLQDYIEQKQYLRSLVLDHFLYFYI